MEQKEQTLEELQNELNIYKARAVYAKYIKDDATCEAMSRAVMEKDHKTVAAILDAECGKAVKESMNIWKRSFSGANISNVTMSDFAKMGYKERVEFKHNYPEEYEKLMSAETGNKY